MTVLKRTKELKKEQKQTKAAAAAQRKVDKQAATQIKKARRAELLTDKENLYTIRKNTTLKLFRVLIWLFLGFIFLRGVIVSLRPDATTEVNQTIQAFKTELTQLQSLDSELLAFAQDFSVNYFTYTSGQETAYTESLKTFAAKSVTGASLKIPYGTSCRVLYANAYKKVQQSANQYDVWVSLVLEYTTTKQLNEGGYTTQTSTEETIVKIPVLSSGGQYIVEDLPVFANDSMIIPGYSIQPFTGRECDSVTRDAILQSLTNFFTAYYQDKQSVINYYLTPPADPQDFMGLGGRVTLEKINTITAYYKNELITDRFVVLVTLSVKDKNGMVLPQSYNLELLFKDKQFYVDRMNTKTHNLTEE